MSEVFRPVNLYCDVGETQATVYIPAEEGLHDNTYSYAVAPCVGCKKWSEAEIERVESEIKEETLAVFGSQSDTLTGIRDGRANQLNQHLVNLARIRGGKYKIVVATCTPIGAE